MNATYRVVLFDEKTRMYVQNVSASSPTQAGLKASSHILSIFGHSVVVSSITIMTKSTPQETRPNRPRNQKQPARQLSLAL